MTYTRFVNLAYYGVSLALCGLILGKPGLIGGAVGLFLGWGMRKLTCKQ